MSEFPGFVSIDFDVEHELVEAMYPHRYRAAYRAVWDARDRIVAAGRWLAVGAGVMAVHALVQTAITASQVLNTEPLLWGVGFIGWTVTAHVLWRTSCRIEEVVP